MTPRKESKRDASADLAKLPLVETECVYMGRRKGEKEMHEAWIALDVLDACSTSDLNQAERLCSWFGHKRKAGKRPVIGGVYKIGLRMEEDKIRSMQAEGAFLRKSIHPAIAAAEARDFAAQSAIEEERAEKKARANPAVMREIETLRRVYQSLPVFSQPAFELMVLRMLRRL